MMTDKQKSEAWNRYWLDDTDTVLKPVFDDPAVGQILTAKERHSRIANHESTPTDIEGIALKIYRDIFKYNYNQWHVDKNVKIILKHLSELNKNN